MVRTIMENQDNWKDNEGKSRKWEGHEGNLGKWEGQ